MVAAGQRHQGSWGHVRNSMLHLIHVFCKVHSAQRANYSCLYPIFSQAVTVAPELLSLGAICCESQNLGLISCCITWFSLFGTEHRAMQWKKVCVITWCAGHDVLDSVLFSNKDFPLLSCIPSIPRNWLSLSHQTSIDKNKRERGFHHINLDSLHYEYRENICCLFTINHPGINGATVPQFKVWNRNGELQICSVIVTRQIFKNNNYKELPPKSTMLLW